MTHREGFALPSNVPHIMRRIRACESEIPAQVVLEHFANGIAAQEYAAGVEAGMKSAVEVARPRKEPAYAWECNECGSQEYTMAVSEIDVQRLGCGNCGGDEWHKAVKEQS